LNRPSQPREWQPPAGTITLRNSEEILSNLYTHQSQPRRREGGGANCHRNSRFGVRNCTTSQSKYRSSEAHGKPL